MTLKLPFKLATLSCLWIGGNGAHLGLKDECDIQFRPRACLTSSSGACCVRFWQTFGGLSDRVLHPIWSLEHYLATTADGTYYYRPNHVSNRIEEQYEHVRLPSLWTFRNASEVIASLNHCPMGSSLIVESTTDFVRLLESSLSMTIIEERRLVIWISIDASSLSPITAKKNTNNARIRILPTGSSNAFLQYIRRYHNSVLPLRDVLVTCLLIEADGGTIDHVIVETLRHYGILCRNVASSYMHTDDYFGTMLSSKFFIVLGLAPPPSLFKSNACIRAAAEVVSLSWVSDAIAAGSIPLISIGALPADVARLDNNRAEYRPIGDFNSRRQLCKGAVSASFIEQIILKTRQQMGDLPVLEISDWRSVTIAALAAKYSHLQMNGTDDSALIVRSEPSSISASASGVLSQLSGVRVPAALSTAFWLNSLIPFDAIDQHIPRGISRVKLFYEHSIAEIVESSSSLAYSPPPYPHIRQQPPPPSTALPLQSSSGGATKAPRKKFTAENSPTRWRSWESIKREFPNSIFLLRNPRLPSLTNSAAAKARGGSKEEKESRGADIDICLLSTSIKRSPAGAANGESSSSTPRIAASRVAKTQRHSGGGGGGGSVSVGEERVLVEIVIPRCCESAKGDLWWLTQLLEHTYISASVYYKCPWCMSESLAQSLTLPPVNTPSQLQAQRQSPNQTAATSGGDGRPVDILDIMSSLRVRGILRSLGKSDAERDALWQLVQANGGVQIVDRILLEKSNRLREYAAFDSLVNGKVTAYLEHIIRNYEYTSSFVSGSNTLFLQQKRLAQYTVFLHTQPAHHLSFDRFSRFMRFVYSCAQKKWWSHESSNSSRSDTSVLLREKKENKKNLMMPATETTVTTGSFDFFNLNYRWLSGVWAHQPEKCVMSLLRYQFAGSTKLGDEARYAAVKDLGRDDADSKAFNEVKMASGVAAQFAVSREAIMRRPLSWWMKLRAVNNGSVPLGGCSHRNYRVGSEVASAMERLWHNFFRDASGMSDSLYLPDTHEDSSIPPFLQRAGTGSKTKLSNKVSSAGTRDPAKKEGRLPPSSSSSLSSSSSSSSSVGKYRAGGSNGGDRIMAKKTKKKPFTVA